MIFDCSNEYEYTYITAHKFSGPLIVYTKHIVYTLKLINKKSNATEPFQNLEKYIFILLL